MPDKIAGFLEVGCNESGEVVVNHLDLKPDENGVGHIVFSPNQARTLAALLNEHANEAERCGQLRRKIAELEQRLTDVELKDMRLGPKPMISEELAAHVQVLANCIAEKFAPPVNRDARCLADGRPETDDHREINPATGMQKDYIVLTPEERAKGLVRPVRSSYRHVGPAGPQHPLRDLGPDEHERYDQYGYVKFEQYPEGSDTLGRYWTQMDLNRVGKGCGVVTTMASSIAETYARDPNFYGGTFCVRCKTHFPVAEFVWEGTQERVGS